MLWLLVLFSDKNLNERLLLWVYLSVESQPTSIYDWFATCCNTCKTMQDSMKFLFEGCFVECLGLEDWLENLEGLSWSNEVDIYPTGSDLWQQRHHLGSVINDWNCAKLHSATFNTIHRPCDCFRSSLCLSLQHVIHIKRLSDTELQIRDTPGWSFQSGIINGVHSGVVGS